MKSSTLIGVAAVGGWVALTCSLWAWALGFVVWHGAVVGVLLVPPVGICLFWLATSTSTENDGLAGLHGLLAASMLVGLLLILPIVGAIIGIVRLVF